MEEFVVVIDCLNFFSFYCCEEDLIDFVFVYLGYSKFIGKDIFLGCGIGVVCEFVE